MKKFLMCAAALLMAVTAVSAQTPEEKEASAKRVEQLKSEAPKACGVAGIDDAAKTAETVAAATVEVADFTALLDGATPSAEQILRATELLQRIEGTSGELKQLTEALGKATSSLKSLKNPMKVKSATRSVSYVKTVLENATPELPYQAKLLGAIVSGK